MERAHYDACWIRFAVFALENDELTNMQHYSLTNRGSTGRCIPRNSLIHMKGRVYDPKIGRFLSADPHIQFAGNAQNYNRYSYVNNNPLAFTGPSGYFLSSIFKAIKKLFKKLIKIIKKVIDIIKKVVKFIKENLRMVIAIVVAVAVAVPIAAGMLIGNATTIMGALKWVALGAGFGTVIGIGVLAGGLPSLISTGSLTAALKGTIFGAITSAVAFGFRAGNALANTFGRAAKSAQVAVHGLIGGTLAKIDDMSFSKGFLSASIAMVLTPIAMDSIKDTFMQGLAIAAIGGIAASLVGRSFEHGFLTAGMAFAANALVTRINLKPSTLGKMSKQVYGLTSADEGELVIDGYTLKKLYETAWGLKAAHFSNGKHGILAFAGTDPSSGADLYADGVQAFGKASMQYQQGVNLALSLDDVVAFTGHSLGGGIAQAAALATGKMAVGFNAAGLHPNTFDRYYNGGSMPNIINIHSLTDALFHGRLAFPWPPRIIYGRNIAIWGGGGHSMDTLCEKIGC